MGNNLWFHNPMGEYHKVYHGGNMEINEGDKVTIKLDITIDSIQYNGDRKSVSGRTSEEYGKYFILGVPLSACHKEAREENGKEAENTPSPKG